MTRLYGVCLRLTVCLWFLKSLPVVADKDKHFCGGSLSFQFVNETTIQVKSLIGWELGFGPCGPGCNASRVGSSTDASRRQVLANNGPVYLGNWTKEVTKGVHTAEYEITPLVNNDTEGYISAVNEQLHWELEEATFKVQIETKASVDVIISGQYWQKLNSFQENKNARYHLQVKIKGGRRNDTGQPNRSPMALFKPVYSVILNTVTVISIPTVDPDDDVTECAPARFVETGRITAMPGVKINKNCTVVVDASVSNHFKDNTMSVIMLKVSDMNPKPISIEHDTMASRPPFVIPVGTIPVQFLVRPVLVLLAPEFITPTPESGQHFTVFAGARLRIRLAAQPHPNSTSSIESIFIVSIPRRALSLTPLKPDPLPIGKRVKYREMTWDTSKSDIGSHVMQATVLDSKGIDGTERNFLIDIKEANVTVISKDIVLDVEMSLPHHGVPPCLLDTVCTFPVYFSASQPLKNVTVVNSTLKSVQIEPLRPDIGPYHYKTEAQVYGSPAGNQTTCLRLFSISKNTHVCFVVTVIPPDKCRQQPCGDHGDCYSNWDKYQCICLPGYTGVNCETQINSCDSSPCFHGQCRWVPMLGTKFYCMCPRGYTGKRCETDIDDCQPNQCQHNGVCTDKVNAFSCGCTFGYHGVKCEYGVGNKEGIPLSSIKDVLKPHFVTPTPSSGSEFVCHANSTCNISLYVESGNISRNDTVVSMNQTYPDVSVNVTRPPTVPGVLTPTHVLLVRPKNAGVFHVCVHVQKAGSTKPTDTVCYKLDVLPSDNMGTKVDMFTSLNTPNNSLIMCHPASDAKCYLKVYSQKPCSQVTTSSPGVQVLTSSVVGGSCVTDVAVTSSQLYAGEVCLIQGSRLCYSVHSANLNKRLPFVGLCINGGIWSSVTRSCVCRVGWQGDRCQSASIKRVNGPTQFAPYNLQNGAVISCTLGQGCSFPVFTTNYNAGFGVPFLIGPISGSMAVDIGAPVKDSNLGTMTPVTVTAPMPGRKTLCFRILPSDSVCYQVDVKTSSAKASSFLEPTLPGGTVLPCSSSTCHMFVYTTPSQPSKCQPVSVSGGSAVSFPEDLKHGVCVTDIAFQPDVGTFCVQLKSGTDKRCYTVEDRTKIKDPCVGETCSHHGSCVTKGSQADCLCVVGYTGNKCDTWKLKNTIMDITKPHIVGPTPSSGSVLECNLKCHLDVIVELGASSNARFVISDHLGLSQMGTISPLPDGTKLVSMTFTSALKKDGFERRCIHVTLTSTSVKGPQWCVILRRDTVNPTQNANINPVTSPQTTVLTCMVDTACSFSLNAKQATKLHFMPNKVSATLVSNSGSTSSYTLTVAPEKTSIGYQDVCIQTSKAQKHCFHYQVLPQPDKVSRSCVGRLKDPEVISPPTHSVYQCYEPLCTLNVFVKADPCIKSNDTVVFPSPSGAGLRETKDLTNHMVGDLKNIVVHIVSRNRTQAGNETCMTFMLGPTFARTPWCIDLRILPRNTTVNAATTLTQTECDIDKLPCKIPFVVDVDFVHRLSAITPGLTPTLPPAVVNGQLVQLMSFEPKKTGVVTMCLDGTSSCAFPVVINVTKTPTTTTSTSTTSSTTETSTRITTPLSATTTKATTVTTSTKHATTKQTTNQVRKTVKPSTSVGTSGTTSTTKPSTIQKTKTSIRTASTLKTQSTASSSSKSSSKTSDLTSTKPTPVSASSTYKSSGFTKASPQIQNSTATTPSLSTTGVTQKTPAVSTILSQTASKVSTKASSATSSKAKTPSTTPTTVGTSFQSSTAKKSSIASSSSKSFSKTSELTSTKTSPVSVYNTYKSTGSTKASAGIQTSTTTTKSISSYTPPVSKTVMTQKTPVVSTILTQTTSKVSARASSATSSKATTPSTPPTTVDTSFQSSTATTAPTTPTTVGSSSKWTTNKKSTINGPSRSQSTHLSQSRTFKETSTTGTRKMSRTSTPITKISYITTATLPSTTPRTSTNAKVSITTSKIVHTQYPKSSFSTPVPTPNAKTLFNSSITSNNPSTSKNPVPVSKVSSISNTPAITLFAITRTKISPSPLTTISKSTVNTSAGILASSSSATSASLIPNTKSSGLPSTKSTFKNVTPTGMHASVVTKATTGHRSSIVSKSTTHMSVSRINKTPKTTKRLVTTTAARSTPTSPTSKTKTVLTSSKWSTTHVGGSLGSSKTPKASPTTIGTTAFPTFSTSGIPRATKSSVKTTGTKSSSGKLTHLINTTPRALPSITANHQSFSALPSSLTSTKKKASVKTATKLSPTLSISRMTTTRKTSKPPVSTLSATSSSGMKTASTTLRPPVTNVGIRSSSTASTSKINTTPKTPSTSMISASTWTKGSTAVPSSEIHTSKSSSRPVTTVSQSSSASTSKISTTAKPPKMSVTTASAKGSSTVPLSGMGTSSKSSSASVSTVSTKSSSTASPSRINATPQTSITTVARATSKSASTVFSMGIRTSSKLSSAPVTIVGQSSSASISKITTTPKTPSTSVTSARAKASSAVSSSGIALSSKSSNAPVTTVNTKHFSTASPSRVNATPKTPITTVSRASSKSPSTAFSMAISTSSKSSSAPVTIVGQSSSASISKITTTPKTPSTSVTSARAKASSAVSSSGIALSSKSSNAPVTTVNTKRFSTASPSRVNATPKTPITTVSRASSKSPSTAFSMAISTSSKSSSAPVTVVGQKSSASTSPKPPKTSVTTASAKGSSIVSSSGIGTSSKSLIAPVTTGNTKSSSSHSRINATPKTSITTVKRASSKSALTVFSMGISTSSKSSSAQVTNVGQRSTTSTSKISTTAKSPKTSVTTVSAKGSPTVPSSSPPVTVISQRSFSAASSSKINITPKSQRSSVTTTSGKGSSTVSTATQTSKAPATMIIPKTTSVVPTPITPKTSTISITRLSGQSSTSSGTKTASGISRAPFTNISPKSSSVPFPRIRTMPITSRTSFTIAASKDSSTVPNSGINKASSAPVPTIAPKSSSPPMHPPNVKTQNASQLSSNKTSERCLPVDKVVAIKAAKEGHMTCVCFHPKTKKYVTVMSPKTPSSNVGVAVGGGLGAGVAVVVLAVLGWKLVTKLKRRARRRTSDSPQSTSPIMTPKASIDSF